MKINIQELVENSQLNEAFYPGKRVVKFCPQPGEFKSHTVIFDWRNPTTIRIEVKAGLTGHDLPTKEIIQYPISFQSPTYIEIDVESGKVRTFTHLDAANDEEDEEDEEGEGSKGKSGGGGKSPLRKSRLSFASAVEGALPQSGKIVDMVVMGKQIAKEAYLSVMNRFVSQIQHAKISATDLIAATGKLVTKFTPPAFLQPKGDEDKVYKYNREKNEPMFSGPMPS